MGFTPHQSENDFQSEVKKLAELYGWNVWHQLDSRGSTSGVADLIMWRNLNKYKLCLIVAELKVEPNKPTAAQCLFIDCCRASGLSAFVWYPENWPEITRIIMSEGAKPCPIKPKETMSVEQVKKLFRLKKFR